MFKKIPLHLFSINALTGEAEVFDFSNPKICHGSGGGSGSTNTVTSAAPPQQVLDAYQTALNAGQSAASAPLQQYGGATIAGFTPDQTSAFNTVDSAQGIAQPYYSAAQNDINAGATNLWNGVQQFSPSAVQQYQSPYTQDVLNTTMASEQNQDQQQQAALQGNAISSGAWGGDRAGVASAVLSGQQDLANNSTNANIENTGYNTALGEFNTQQQNQLGANEATSYLNENAGVNLGGLGTTAENQALTGANAQEASGAIQQQLGQAALNVPYEQFEQQQAYPLQTAQYFANIAEGLGAGAGGLGSSTTTAASPSVASQAAGFGLGGLGIYGATQSLGSGASAAEDASEKRGGRIGMRNGGALGTRRGYAFGGLTTSPDLGDSIAQSSQIPNISMSFVPSPMGGSATSGGRGAGGPPQATSAKTTGGQQPSGGLNSNDTLAIKGGAKLARHFMNSPSSSGNTNALDPGSSSATDMQGEVNPMDVSNPGGDTGALNAMDTSGGAGGTVGDSGAAAGSADAGSSAAAGSSALDAASSSSAAAGTAAASGAADTSLSMGAFDALGAGSTAGIIDGATAAAAVDSGIAEAGADIGGAAIGDALGDAAMLALLAKRGGRIEALGTRKHYDAGGQVGGGQTPMAASSAVTGPLTQTYNSSYQNMTPQQLQQIMMRLPAGSQQQQAAQAVLKQKQMMPNVGVQAQGGLGSQQSQVATPGAAPQQAQGMSQQPPMARGGRAHGYATDGAVDDSGDDISIPYPPPPDESAPLAAAQNGNSIAPINASQLSGGMGSGRMTASAVPPSSVQLPGDAYSGKGAMGAQRPAASTSDYSTEEPPNTRAPAKANPWLALASAGFGMAGGTSPNAGINIARGAQEGLQNYSQQQKEADTVNESADKLMAEAKIHKDAIAIEQQNADTNQQSRLDTAAYQKGLLANDTVKTNQGKFTIGKDPITGNMTVFNAKTGQFVTPPNSQSGQPDQQPYIDPATGEVIGGAPSVLPASQTRLTPTVYHQMAVEDSAQRKAAMANEPLGNNILKTLDGLEPNYANVDTGGYASKAEQLGAKAFNPNGQYATSAANMDKGTFQLATDMNKFQYAPGSRGSVLGLQTILNSKPGMDQPYQTNMNITNELRGRVTDYQAEQSLFQQWRQASPYHVTDDNAYSVGEALRTIYPTTNVDQKTGAVTFNKANAQAMRQAIPDAIKNPQKYLDMAVSGSAQPTTGASGGNAPVPQMAPDGNHYIPDPNRPGKFLQVVQ